ncbi:hypothetical protein [Microbulbifer sp. VAAF005]|uniref:tetratricopeptide repeat protein n=1 Tax=Microbulbifer sp. VAAF005 TaxID=3034230 RepID=UPI0024ACC7C2|nr:hypothetical protein [Microbulbifer sp. VAAF005]WHI48479.1 hypothetical protein P0078_08930 [Microbulbifer sp. VAAF005]
MIKSALLLIFFVIFCCFEEASADLPYAGCTAEKLNDLDEKIGFGEEHLLDERIICLIGDKDYHLAERDVNRYLELEGDDADMYIILAEIYANTKRCSRVSSAIRSAVDVRRDGMSLYTDGAKILMGCGDRESAIIFLKRGISIVEKDLDAKSGGRVVFFPALEKAKKLLKSLE